MSLDAPVLDEDGNGQTLLDLLPDEAPPTDESAAIRIDVGCFVEGLRRLCSNVAKSSWPTAFRRAHERLNPPFDRL